VKVVVVPLYISEKALHVLGDIAEKRGTTVGAMISESLRNIVKQEVGEIALAEIEREI